jgi:protein-tyrosine phosphatase
MANLLNKNIKSLLFVCLGNICRSPTAESVFKAKAKQKNIDLTIDSAGTLSMHTGNPPDSRSQEAGIKRGYSFKGIKARQVSAVDFDKFDLVLAMDKDNLHELHKVAPKHLHYKIQLFLDFATHFTETEVPDPYYGGEHGFDTVLDLVEDASDGLIKAM